MRPIGAILLAASLCCGGCTSVVQYSNELVEPRHGRTWFTRLPATIGGTTGFAVGLPVDVVALPVAWVWYTMQPRETRDALSVFLFPSFVFWRLGLLLGAPFDAVEWAAWRAWQPEAPITQEDRERIERAWDAMEYTEYPVTPIHPPPTDVDGGQ
ncbi:MAG: hypothetical protein JNL08_07640 [Planctomycetes bacterium]|nr:hypothetical protein [Planctomycetota bacterium]